MKRSKETRTAFRAKMKTKLKKGGKFIGRTIGFVAGAGLDMAPLPLVNKIVPNVARQFVPQLDEIVATGEQTIVTDVIPLIRTIKTLRAIIERLLQRLGLI